MNECTIIRQKNKRVLYVFHVIVRNQHMSGPTNRVAINGRASRFRLKLEVIDDRILYNGPWKSWWGWHAGRGRDQPRHQIERVMGREGHGYGSYKAFWIIFSKYHQLKLGVAGRRDELWRYQFRKACLERCDRASACTYRSLNLCSVNFPLCLIVLLSISFQIGSQQSVVHVTRPELLTNGILLIQYEQDQQNWASRIMSHFCEWRVQIMLRCLSHNPPVLGPGYSGSQIQWDSTFFRVDAEIMFLIGIHLWTHSPCSHTLIPVSASET